MICRKDMTCRLFPAQAGVIPCAQQRLVRGYSVPRASGGDPKVTACFVHKVLCSPRKRG